MKSLEDLAKFPSENPNPVLRVTINKILYVNKAGELLLSVKEGDSIPKIIQSGLTEALNHNIFKTLEPRALNSGGHEPHPEAPSVHQPGCQISSTGWRDPHCVLPIHRL